MSTAESDAWTNWSGLQQHHPTRVATPASADVLHDLLQEAGRKNQRVRCVGSGHSFVPFWCDDLIVSLDGLSGLLCVDSESRRVTLGAGTKIHDMGPALWAEGLSLPQQGDIDRQTIAGALSTGTHGTGRSLPNLSHSLVAATLMTAAGELVHIDGTAAPDRLLALRVSLGLLGVLTEVTLQVESAFHLHERTWQADITECESRLTQLIGDNRHFEFFWTPRTDSFEMKTLNRTDDAPRRISAGEYIAPAWEAFPSDRDVRFNEMEYSVPYDAGWSCFIELRKLCLDQFPKLPWPIEFRTLAADDAWLSTAGGRESVTLSVHQGADRDHRPLFDAAEAIFRNHGGRPHWGKLHSLQAEDLQQLYPDYGRFCELRESMDPEARFCNAFLAGLFNAGAR